MTAGGGAPCGGTWQSHHTESRVGFQYTFFTVTVDAYWTADDTLW